jgi:hypothetical protein
LRHVWDDWLFLGKATALGGDTVFAGGFRGVAFTHKRLFSLCTLLRRMNHQHHVAIGRTTTTRPRIPLAFQKVFLSANRGGTIASTDEAPHGVRARRWFAPAAVASFPPRPPPPPPRPENTKYEITKMEADKNVPRNPTPLDKTVDELVKVGVIDRRSPRKSRRNKKCKVRPLDLREYPCRWFR